MEALMRIGYVTREPDDRVIRPTERALHKKNPNVQLSSSGKSIILYYAGDSVEPRAVELHVPVKGMLSINEAETLQKLAKITFSNLDNT